MKKTDKSTATKKPPETEAVGLSDLEKSVFKVSGKNFRLVKKDEITGERWDFIAPQMERISSGTFSILKIKWEEILQISSHILVAVSGKMEIADIYNHFKESKDFSAEIAATALLGFGLSNTAWLNVLDLSFSARPDMKEAVKEAMKASARQYIDEKKSGQQKN